MNDIKKGLLSKDEKPVYCLPIKDKKEEGYIVMSVNKVGREYQLHPLTERTEVVLKQLPQPLILTLKDHKNPLLS